MVTASAAARLRPARLPLRCAAALAALSAAALPAGSAAQTPCAGPAWAVQNDGNYHFSYSNRQQGGAIAFCVRNHHRRRAVFVDWRGAGLRSAIPPGRTIFRTSLRGGRAAPRLFPFFYGARPNQIDVPTIAARGGFPPRSALAAALLFRRAALRQPDEAAPEAGGNNSLVYVPNPLVQLMASVLAVTAGLSPEAIRRIETNPDSLVPFAMTFDQRLTADPRGGVAIAYECRYHMGPGDPRRRRGRASPPADTPSSLYLRFSDPALHRLMFGRDDETPLRGWAPETVLRATASASARDLVAARSASLDVLLGDRRTVIASIPVTYSAPAS